MAHFKKTILLLLLSILLVFSCKNPTEPLTEEPTTEEPTAEEPTAEEPTAEKPAAIPTVTGLLPYKAATAELTAALTLSWDAFSGADHYEIQIATSAGDMDAGTTTSVSATSYSLDSDLSGSQYWFWRVRAVDAGGLAGAWSEINSITLGWETREPTQNDMGTTTTDTTPAFGWITMPGTKRYEIQLATSEGDVGGADLTVVDGESYIPGSPLANKTTYYWRVRAVADDVVNSGEVKTPWSIVSSFTLDWGTSGPADGICFAEELALLTGTAYLSGTYTLNADIDLSTYGNWTPIGTSSKPFTGSFDGQGHTIKGLTISGSGTYQGLFGFINTTGSIENLQLTEVSITSTTGSNGALAGYCSGNLSSISCQGSVSGYQNTGGMVGRFINGAISSCSSQGDVTGSNYFVGGLLGKLESLTTSSEISNSWSTCTVDGSKGSVGGLIGVVDVTSGTNTTIESCYATGLVRSSSKHSGGLIGELYNYVSVNNCYATGNVDGTDYCGGLIGSAKIDSTNESFVRNSYSSGNVSGTTNLGGFIGADGYYDSYTYYAVEIHGCYATGQVVGTSAIGGFVGNYYGSAKIKNSYARGTVTGSDRVGGFLGSTGKNPSGITMCYSTGLVTGGIDNIGGFCGSGTSTTIVSCFYDRDTSGGMTDTSKGTPKYMTDMKNQTTYTSSSEGGWDFVGELTNGSDDFWKIDSSRRINSGYPYLASVIPQ